ncbi:MAG: hypothetical protein H6740_25240 [Alphaproteobacteria bacterium]|nr:hypothetical protein [Alphaproteobacteria bacterium]
MLVFELGTPAECCCALGHRAQNKVYAELVGRPGARWRARCPAWAACRRLAEDFVMIMLERAGLPLPRWALAVSDLVPVEQKRHFAELMPRLHGGLATGPASA